MYNGEFRFCQPKHYVVGTQGFLNNTIHFDQMLTYTF